MQFVPLTRVASSPLSNNSLIVIVSLSPGVGVGVGVDESLTVTVQLPDLSESAVDVAVTVYVPVVALLAAVTTQALLFTLILTP